ncbi:MAG TPA: hypothetical protein VGA94_01715, partial [Thermodesulfobacteriota bacterium]
QWWYWACWLLALCSMGYAIFALIPHDKGFGVIILVVIGIFIGAAHEVCFEHHRQRRLERQIMENYRKRS